MIDIKKVHRLTGIYADATTRKLNTGQGTQLSPAVHLPGYLPCMHVSYRKIRIFQNY